MFRYMAFCWSMVDPIAAQAAERFSRRLQTNSSAWHLALQRPGCKVYYADARPNANQAYVLTPDRGVVLGKLFRRNQDDESFTAAVQLSNSDAEKIIESRGRDLIDRYWGRYVAFLADAASGGIRVVRDPTGALPCFGTRHGQLQVYFSWTEDALRLGIPTFSINWHYVAVHVPSIVLECRETALNEVFQVLPSECLDAHGNDITSNLQWHPADLASASVIEDPTVAAPALRRTVRTCVQAWASCYDGLMVRLSGGLDSSIVLSCLNGSSTGPKVVCLNYFSPGSDSDERGYARVMAAAAHRDLIERERDSGFRLEQILEIARTPRPSFYLGYLEQGSSEATLAHAYGASAICTGAGGDQLFYQNPTVWPAADYAIRHGWGPSLLRVALDAARLARSSIWRALGTALRETWSFTPTSLQTDIGEYFTLIDPEVIDAARHDERFLLPALKPAVRLPPGKLRQIRSFAFPIEYYDPFGREDDPESIHPLFSQPVMELCLRIPTYVLANGGWDRALARQAFAGDLPRLIARRRSKGGQEEHVKSILLRNMDFVRGLLLDGALVQQRLLNRAKLEEVLSGRPTAIATSMVELCTFLSIEAWLHSWSENRQQDRRVAQTGWKQRSS